MYLNSVRGLTSVFIPTIRLRSRIAVADLEGAQQTPPPKI